MQYAVSCVAGCGQHAQREERRTIKATGKSMSDERNCTSIFNICILSDIVLQLRCYKCKITFRIRVFLTHFPDHNLYGPNE
jgi:hypothetical protein